MSSDSVVRDLFRSLESSLHERLGMIEDVIRMRLNASPQEEDDGSGDRIRALEELVATLTDRLVALEMTREEAKEVHVHRVGAGGEEIAAVAAPKTEEIWIEPMRDLKIELPAAVTPVVVPEVVVAKPLAAKPLAAKPLNKIVEEPVQEEVEEEEVEEEVVEEEVVEEEVIEEEVVEEEVVEEEVVEEEVVEEEVVEEEVVEDDNEGRGGEGGQHAPPEEEAAEEEAEEGVAVEQFEYKGKTYFRDSDNQVYAASKEDPDQPDENTIGTWDTARERILFRRSG
jgi:hypothetical protein